MSAIKSALKSPLLKKAISLLFYLFLALFLYFYLKQIDFSKLKGVRLSWNYLAIASLFAITFRYWGAYIWLTLLKGLGAKKLTDTPRLIEIYAKSWLGRYIPGTAPWILGKIYFASKQGISKNKLAVSSLLEGGLQIVVVMFIAFVMLIFDDRLDVVDGKIKLLLVLIMVCLIISMVPAVFNKIVSLAYKLLRKKTLAKEHLASGKLITKGALLYAIGSLLTGFSFFFIAKAVYPDLAFKDALFVMGVSNLATALSMLAIFAPSGLGVREGVQLVALGIIIPKEYALVIVITTRVWAIVIDFVFVGATKAFTLFR